MRFSRSSNRALILSSLMASSALLAPSVAFATTPAPAGADESAERGIENFDPQPHGVGAITVTATNGGAAVGVIDPSEVVESPGITINNNFTPNDARDPVNINGVGQIFTDAGGGSLGLCTGTLINPRTVLFAAHCVNTRPATAYGANSGGVGTAVGFETNTRANAPGQVDELVNWLLGVGAGPGQFRTNQAQAMYNINQVFYDPRSLAPASCTNPTSCFLEADIATGVLDTPAGNVPTWALLFSPLDAPATINPATGTGYHVTITGYGRNGTGTTGAVGNDWRRRVAENMLGALVSLDQRNLFLFGTTGTPSRPQPLYFLDFDDPARGTAAANPRDFNGFRDNALPREGLTGPGDSGGPLILDQTFSRQVVIGVLSGGSTFFAGQPGGSYGTQSFYQPLFLYWDWIVANNPYRYVTATAGNRNWEDASGWLTELDPNYTIISGGQLVNGLPTNIGAGATPGRVLGFGEQCFQSPLNSATPPATNECENIRTGALRNGVPNNPSDMAPVSGMLIEQLVLDGSDSATSDGTGQRTMARSGLDGVLDSAQTTGFSVTANPAPTIANGLPGATNFVPNNVDGVRATGVIGRYYDVTLRNAGAITLNSAVTIDRFTVRGAASQLNIASGASLTSLIDVQQMTGTINNNGTLISRGDYLLMSGLLTGSGTVRTPFLTSVLGTIAPGTTTSIGTVAVNGNLVLSSGSSLMINLGAGGTSDLVAMTANGTSTGAANLGGGVFFSPVAGYVPVNGDRFTFLTAAGGVTGTFAAPTSLSAILSPQLTYSANAVSVQIVAGRYVNVANSTPVQRAYSWLLDRNRGNATLSSLYTTLDAQNAATIQATLDGLAPRTETLRDAVSSVMIDNANRFYRDRLGSIDTSASRGGTIATIGQPLQLASAAMVQQPGEAGTRTDAAMTSVREGALPDNMSAFLAAGYIEGSSAQMATAVPAGARDQFNGWYVAAGLEADVDTGTVMGVGLSYTDTEGSLTATSGSFEGSLIQATLYGRMDTGSGLTLDAQLSGGKLQTRTRRQGSFVTTPFDLRSTDNPWTYTTEVGLGYDLGNDERSFGPRLAFRASRIELGTIRETGGAMALDIDRQSVDSAQVRAGLNFADKGSVRPYASATFVHDFADRPAAFGANFIGGLGPNAGFALVGQDQNWVELSLGLAIEHGNTSLSLSADTTVQRSDVRNQAYRASVTMRF